MGITGNYWMKFVGKPGGKLMKHAPGNYEHGKLYKVPYGHSKQPFWELVEKPPELKVQEETESFEEAYYVPDDEEQVMEITSSLSVDEISMTTSAGYEGNAIIDPNAPAIIEPYMMYNTETGELADVPELPFEEEPEVSEADMLKREIARLTLALEEAKTTPSVKFEPETTEPSRDDLLKTLKEAGVEVKSGTRTTTLKKMVDGLGEN